MKFTYRSGQRPLDGYTIKRGVGQGGFGEVYFAVSDAGKEVALKLLHRQPDAELRGIAHCLNLKHPNLIHLFDLRTDDRGDRWVVMEYIFGESLAQWINRYPTGLPTDLVKEWFAALCRGVGYLHDQGIVHRDLKPANVFIESGHLKVGDYGLSRRVSISQGGEMTQGVGTPNYMAPEIKSGNYTQSIDIYALGVILYEMLTGHPPFEGQTPGEVMMKHLTDRPDLSRAPEAFRPVLERALDKNPVTRFGSVKELAKAVENVGAMAPEPYAVIESPPKPMASTTPDAPRSVPPRPVAIPVPALSRSRYAAGPIPEVVRPRLAELAGAVAFAPLVAALCTAPWVFFTSDQSWTLLGRVFLLATALTWGALVVARPLPDPKRTWGRRFQMLLVGAAVGLYAFWLDGWTVSRGSSPTDSNRDIVLWNNSRISLETFSTAMHYLFYFGLATAACRWWSMADPRRKERFRLLPIVTSGLWASVLLFLWPWGEAPAALAIAPLVIAAVCVQVASPWAPAPARPVARPIGRKYRYAVAVLAGLLFGSMGCREGNRPRSGGADSHQANANRKLAETAAVEAAKSAANYQAGLHPEIKRKTAIQRTIESVKGWQGLDGAVVIAANPEGILVPTPTFPVVEEPKAPASRGRRKVLRSPAVISERVGTEIPYPTESEAENRVLEEAQKLIEQRLRELDPPVEYRPPATVVKNEYVRPDSRLVRIPTDTEKTLLTQNGYDADRRYVEYTVEVTADQVRELRTRTRVAESLRGLGAVVAVVLAGFLFLRLDEWSRGYLTSWLALAAAALGGGIIAALVFV